MKRLYLFGLSCALLIFAGCSGITIPALSSVPGAEDSIIFPAKSHDRVVFEYHQGTKVTRRTLTITSYPFREDFNNCNLVYYARKKDKDGKNMKEQVSYPCPSSVTIYKDILDENAILFNGSIVFLKYKAVRRGYEVYYAPTKITLTHEPDPKFFDLGVSGRTIKEGRNNDIGDNMIVYYLKADKEYKFPKNTKPKEIEYVAE